MPNTIDNINQNLRVWARRMGVEVSPITMEKVEELLPWMDKESRMIPMSLVAMQVMRERMPWIGRDTGRYAGIVIGVTAKNMVYNEMEFKEAGTLVRMNEEQRKLLTPHFQQMKEICLEMVEARNKEKELLFALLGAIRNQIKNGSAMDWDS